MGGHDIIATGDQACPSAQRYALHRSHGEAGVGPKAVEQPIKPFGICSVFFGRVGACVAHHVDIGACAEVLSFASQDEGAQVGRAVLVVERILPACTALGGPLEQVNEFLDHFNVHGVKFLRASERKVGLCSLDGQ